MAYTTKDAISALNGYLGVSESDRHVIDDTKDRGFVLNIPSGEDVVIYTYPLVHKEDGAKTYFDTRDSGPKERMVAWEYALSRGMKYFCLGVNSSVKKYEDYVFSLECDEKAIELLSGLKDGERSGPGNQVIIPITFTPSQSFERLQNRLGVYISVIHKSMLANYLNVFDNRPYLNKFSNDILKKASKSTLPDLISAEEMVDPKEQKERFRNWAEKQQKTNGEPYSPNTINTYISTMETCYSQFEKYKKYDSVFQIQNPKELSEYINAVFDDPGFDDFNKNHASNQSCSRGMQMYQQFVDENKCVFGKPCFETSLQNPMPRNRIVFGAPGTGKSFTLNKERMELLGEENETDYERVTFHPDYSYANFVGTYKPAPCKDDDGNDTITYEYVPGPFMRVYVKALKSGRTENPKPFLLIIEEINRSNVAAVFGDIFQLLDRGDNGVSEFPIEASEDIKKYLLSELGGELDDYSKILIPNNMFIWATMNSADQGVFPMDTAFKRRWDFTYLGIDEHEKDLVGKTVVLGKGQTAQKVEWNKLRKAINRFLANQKINEDKQLGPYFISRSIVVPKEGDEIDREKFIDTFKNKVIMYLFEDAAKQKRPDLFKGCFENSSRYSEICKEFDEKGIGIFFHEIQTDADPEDLNVPLADDGE